MNRIMVNAAQHFGPEVVIIVTFLMSLLVALIPLLQIYFSKKNRNSISKQKPNINLS